MDEPTLNIKLNCNSERLVKKIDRVTLAAERLNKELEKIKSSSIEISVSSSSELKKKWWQLWK